MPCLIFIHFIIFDLVVLLSGLPNEQDWYTVEKRQGIPDWVELREHDRSIRLNLTHQYMAYVNRSLPFEFPFYGEDFTNIKITTQGFICLSDIVSDTQYIGPLAANFKPLPASKPTQYIGVLYNSDSVIIQWGDMQLAKQSSVGMFDFQLRLDVLGGIRMLYKSVPIPVDKIEADDHFVSAGISGGHPMGQTVPIPYSIISLTDVTPSSTYILTPRATCIDQKDCNSCISWSSMCAWCDNIQQCSTGQDRLKSKWQQNSCFSSSTRLCTPTTVPPTYNTSATYPMSTTPPTDKIRPTPGPTPPHTSPTETRPTQPPRGKSPISLPVIYVILIVASSLSFCFVVAAFIILVWHKRQVSLLQATLISSAPETNNLISDGLSNGHDHSGHDNHHGDHNGSVKC